jgi:hypothetical protein|tara:strand:+ start:521 stop:733 length:213 start_codon:yes stop_codon:yes gene_type:complete
METRWSFRLDINWKSYRKPKLDASFLFLASYVIQHRIENPIATSILSGEFVSGDTIQVDEAGGELTFAKA